MNIENYKKTFAICLLNRITHPNYTFSPFNYALINFIKTEISTSIPSKRSIEMIRNGEYSISESDKDMANILEEYRNWLLEILNTLLAANNDIDLSKAVSKSLIRIITESGIEMKDI